MARRAWYNTICELSAQVTRPMRDSLGGTTNVPPAVRGNLIIHRLFDISILLKGIDGALETIGGVLLLFVNPEQIHNFARVLTQHELSEDPHDLVATYLLNSTRSLATGAKTFAALYLVWHGVVKVMLVTALLLKRRWAYPTALLAFLIFLLYQLYRYLHTFSPELLVLSALDVLVLGLTWLEYQRLLKSHEFWRDDDTKPQPAVPG